MKPRSIPTKGKLTDSLRGDHVRVFSLLILLMLTPLVGVADDNLFDRYDAIREGKGLRAAGEFLEKVAEEEKDNPDFYAASGNFWWRASKEGVVISREPAKPGGIRLVDPGSGEDIGSIDSRGERDPEMAKRAIDIMTEGVGRFPWRADIAFGLAHVHKESGNINSSAETLIALMGEAKKGPEKLKWMKNGGIPDGAEKFIPGNVQTYSYALFQADTPTTDALLDRLTSAVIEAFPDDPMAYNMQAALADAKVTRRKP